jgi:hypothetical protein
MQGSNLDIQLGEGSAHGASGGRKEDYEALQHSCACKEDIQRTQAAQAPEARECACPTKMPEMRSSNTHQIISLSDIFISPLEDMYVSF